MALPTGTAKNADGLVVKFSGQYEVGNNVTVNRARAVNTMYGPFKILEFDLDLKAAGASTTYFPFDLTNDGLVRDGFSDEEAYLPSGCYVKNVTVICTEIAAGGTSFALGTYSVTGATLDDDGLVTDTEAVLASMDHVGDVIIGNGALVGDTSGGSGPAADSWIAVKTTGTFTAGKAKILIEYVATN